MLVGDLVVPGEVRVVEGPGVFGGCACGLGADGHGGVAVGVEGLVEVDEVDGFGVYAAHDVEVVVGPDSATGRVRRHFAFMFR